jgi:hypothetical protein
MFDCGVVRMCLFMFIAVCVYVCYCMYMKFECVSVLRSMIVCMLALDLSACLVMFGGFRRVGNVMRKMEDAPSRWS